MQAAWEGSSQKGNEWRRASGGCGNFEINRRHLLRLSKRCDSYCQMGPRNVISRGNDEFDSHVSHAGFGPGPPVKTEVNVCQFIVRHKF